MFPLHPEIPDEGIRVADLFGGRTAQLEAMRTRLTGLMEAEGLPYGKLTHTYNTRLAQELAKWAETQPDGAQIHDALYRAYFVDGVNLADIDELVKIADGLGLSPEEAKDIVENRACKEAVSEDWRRSREVGVTGVPTYMVGDKRVVGAQPYEALEALAVNAGAVRRDTE